MIGSCDTYVFFQQTSHDYSIERIEHFAPVSFVSHTTLVLLRYNFHSNRIFKVLQYDIHQPERKWWVFGVNVFIFTFKVTQSRPQCLRATVKRDRDQQEKNVNKCNNNRSHAVDTFVSYKSAECIGAIALTSNAATNTNLNKEIINKWIIETQIACWWALYNSFCHNVINIKMSSLDTTK